MISAKLAGVQTRDAGESVLEELRKRALTTPKSRLLLTDRAAVSTTEERIDVSDFIDLLPQEWRGDIIGVHTEPLYYFRLAADGRIIASDKPIVGSVLEGYLVKVDLTRCGVGPHNYRDVLKGLGVYGRYFGYKNDNENKEDSEILNDLAGIPVYYYVDVNPALGKIALKRWEEFLWDLIFMGADEYIMKAYLPTLAPFNGFSVRVAPNLILGAPTGTGKTTIASVLGLVFERITEATLHGGKFNDTVSAGIVHGFDGLVQIETLETQTLRTLVGGLLGLTARGEAVVGVYGTKLKTEFKGPVYITFNTQGGTQKVLSTTLANIAAAIALNPEALAGRFALLASRYVLPLGETPLVQKDVSELVREAIQAAKRLTQGKLAALLDPSAIAMYVNEVTHETDELPFVELASENLQTYFRTLQETIGKHVARLGFCAAIAKHLDDIYTQAIARDTLLRRALEEAMKYKEMIDQTVKEIGDLLDESLENYLTTLPKNREKRFTYALIVALYNVAVSRGGLIKWGAIRKGELLEVRVEELFKEFKASRIYANISAPKFRERLSNPSTMNDPALTFISFNYSEEKDIVTCDLSQLIYAAEVMDLN